MANSVIFIGSPEKSPKSWTQNLKLFYMAPNEIIFRIFTSFVPPIFKKYQKIHVDLLGPALGVLLLAAFVNYGYSFKIALSLPSPTEIVVIFSILMPLLCFLLCKLGHSRITLYETTSLIGYALYGHIFTLCISFLYYEESSNFLFFVCLIIFGGLSTLRLALVFMGTIAVPATRLLVCSIISVVNILFLVYLHFAYMHRTYLHRIF